MIAARPAISVLLAASLLGMILLLAGCKREEHRPTEQSEIKRRATAVQQAEHERVEAQQQAPREAATQPAPVNNTLPSAPAAPPAAGYLPPSEDGADVQITETPLDGSPPAGINVPVHNAPGSGTESATSPAAPRAGGQVPPSGAMAKSAPSASLPGASPPGDAVDMPDAVGMTGAAAAPDAAALSTTAARTSAEAAHALNQDLQRQLREFDALMRKASENAARERAATAAGGGSPHSHALRGEGRLEEPPEGIGAGGAAQRATGLGNTPDLSGEMRDGARPLPPSRRAAANLPDGADDDIVSRQLREAAERETDPVLRDKLWEEYRKYKGGL